MTSDGRIRLYRAIQDIAGSLDRHHGLKGIGVIILFGNVLQPLPDIKISLEGIAQFAEGDALYLTQENLLIPDDMRVTQGDRIALMPVQAENSTKFLIACKIRMIDIQPFESVRYGYNGDLYPPNEFVGVQVTVHGQNENKDSDVLVQGDTIEITSFGGAAVKIDGINFKNHTHPGGGPPV
jgi:hypothetical protein